jgi:hypothetical protein
VEVKTYVNKQGVAVCLRCGAKAWGIQRPDYGKRIIYMKGDK